MDEFGTGAVEASVVNATGLIVGPTGMGNFRATLIKDHVPVGIPDGPVGPSIGVHHPLTAEVHIAVRDHGKAKAGMVGAQISDVFGGCPGGVGCKNVQASIHLP